MLPVVAVCLVWAFVGFLLGLQYRDRQAAKAKEQYEALALEVEMRATLAWIHSGVKLDMPLRDIAQRNRLTRQVTGRKVNT